NFKIRKMLAAIVKKQLRITPELTYFIDDSLDYAEKIDQLLKK
ncbi:MAG: ribosome-binding factor A, partial [Bacteroidia bacterium]